MTPLAWAWGSRIRMAAQFAGGSYALTHITWHDRSKRALFSEPLPYPVQNRFCPWRAFGVALSVTLVSYLKATRLTWLPLSRQVLSEIAINSAVAFADTMAVSTIMLNLAVQIEYNKESEQQTEAKRAISRFHWNLRSSSALAMHLSFGWIAYRLLDITLTFGESSATLMRDPLGGLHLLKKALIESALGEGNLLAELHALTPGRLVAAAFSS